MNDVFQFVEQFLGAADAEGRDQYRAAVGQGMLDDVFQALPAGTAVFVQAVAVGAFDHQDVRAVRRFGGRQQRCMWCTQVAGENDAFLLAGVGIVQVDLHISRAEDMPGALQANAADQVLCIVQGEPCFVGQGDDALFD